MLDAIDLFSISIHFIIEVFTNSQFSIEGFPILTFFLILIGIILK